MSKPKGFMSKLNGVTLVFTLVGTSLFTFVAVSQRSEASETLRSSKSAANIVTAVNACADDLGRQLKRLKAKRSHRRDAPPQIATDPAL